MKKICYIANMRSPHVRQWLELLNSDVELSIATIDTEIDFEGLELFDFKLGEVLCIPKFLRFIPQQLRYVILGFLLRIQNYRFDLCHAHNASGYGLSALLSGNKFLLTTYGSEIYNSATRSRLYNYILRKILNRAELLTASTPYMKTFLESHFPETEGKVKTFSLGVRNSFFCGPFERKKSKVKEGPVWFSSRRILPLYRTLEVTRAFKVYKKKGGKGSLVLLQGDASGEYFELIKREVLDCSDIRLVEGFVDTRTIIGLLDEADFIISVPISDQLSSSILEGMARQCVPILSSLEAYAPISNNVIFVRDQPNYQSALEKIFEDTAKIDSQERQRLSIKCHRKIKVEFSKDKAQQFYCDIIESLTRIKRIPNSYKDQQ
ncbi:MAG: glycosyltransferase involved in cell wall biosynthesis [Oleiphilaceae bacterium]|jgi:glycosyltransferase involved in cell wall biosynthesis